MDEYGTCVHTAAGEFEAQQVKAFLKANGIPCTIEGEALRNTHGLTVDGLGAARIVVPNALADTARELLATAEAGELQVEEVSPKEGVVLPFPERKD